MIRIIFLLLTSLFDFEDALNPSDHLVRGGVRWLVKVDHTVAFKLNQRTSCGRPSAGQGGEVVSLHVQLVKVLS